MELGSILDRDNKVSLGDLGDPYRDEYIDTLPDIGAGRDFTDLVLHFQAALDEGKHIIVMIGGHVIKCGLGPHICRLIDMAHTIHIAMNGAAAIHDYELAMWGGTSEDVEVALPAGRFGMWEEARTMNPPWGQHDNFRAAILQEDIKYRSGCILASDAWVTIHPAVGTDYTHWLGDIDAEEYGRLQFRELERFYESIIGLTPGSIVLNLGSAVILPEIFLKAISKATNEGKSLEGVICANMDMGMPYRALQQIVHRPRLLGMTTYNFVGMHELMIPLLMREVLGWGCT